MGGFKIYCQTFVGGFQNSRLKGRIPGDLQQKRNSSTMHWLCYLSKIPSTWEENQSAAPLLILKIPETNKHLDVSENSGTPKSSILIRFSIINHPFWGTPFFGNTHLDI